MDEIIIEGDVFQLKGNEDGTGSYESKNNKKYHSENIFDGSKGNGKEQTQSQNNSRNIENTVRTRSQSKVRSEPFDGYLKR
ncbi:hypothetical protein E8L90_05440 [Brevibacillus antibioticus]|uniref:Uncharacterized protein n=1 Tax=Brevibacillus antibioticus TaxID=2570228 RepID=A0A4U2Y4C1_9BACL|nr:hypothetical protein [Brevibacillus antibioticus]TKI54934.1 hypothetical protein E8L90_05440 [Brevibacillus antibioticus]